MLCVCVCVCVCVRICVLREKGVIKVDSFVVGVALKKAGRDKEGERERER